MNKRRPCSFGSCACVQESEGETDEETDDEEWEAQQAEQVAGHAGARRRRALKRLPSCMAMPTPLSLPVHLQLPLPVKRWQDCAALCTKGCATAWLLLLQPAGLDAAPQSRVH